MHAVPIRFVGERPHLEADAAGDLAKLRVEVLPFTYAQVVEVLRLAHATEGTRPQLALLLAEVAPQREVAEEVRVADREPAVELHGRLLVLTRPLPRVLDRQAGRDDEELGHAPVVLGLEDHPPDAGVDREAGQAPTHLRQPHLGAGPVGTVESAQLLEQQHAVGDGTSVGWLHERERRHVTEARARPSGG